MFDRTALAAIIIGLIGYIVFKWSRDKQRAIESAIIAAVYSLGDGAHAVSVRKKAEDITGKPISVGRLYTGLNKLERLGIIRSWQEPGGPERNDRSRRHFALNADYKASPRPT